MRASIWLNSWQRKSRQWWDKNKRQPAWRVHCCSDISSWQKSGACGQLLDFGFRSSDVDFFSGPLFFFFTNSFGRLIRLGSIGQVWQVRPMRRQKECRRSLMTRAIIECSSSSDEWDSRTIVFFLVAVLVSFVLYEFLLLLLLLAQSVHLFCVHLFCLTLPQMAWLGFFP